MIEYIENLPLMFQIALGIALGIAIAAAAYSLLLNLIRVVFTSKETAELAGGVLVFVAVVAVMSYFGAFG